MVKSPQGNAITERLHVVMSNILHISHERKEDLHITDAVWAVCSTHYPVLGYSLGTPVFQ